MKKYYHITHTNNMGSILEYGLRIHPRVKGLIGPMEDPKETEGKIFLGITKGESLAQLNPEDDVNEFSMLEITLPSGYRHYMDRNGLRYVVKNIPPEYIRPVALGVRSRRTYLEEG